MKKRIRKKFLAKKTIIYVTVILIVNTLGISYAFWNNGLNIGSKITTGEMLPCFVGDSQEELYRNDDGEWINISRDDDRIFIDGRVMSYTGNIPIKFKNKGSVPFKINDIDKEENDYVSIDDIEDISLEPDEKEAFNVHLNITDDITQEFDFKYEIFVKQDK